MSIQTLDKLLICHIDCSIWSGRKKLRPEDFRLANGSQLPPKDVASLGSKKICDPEALANFERLKKEAQRLCEQVGVRFLGGYAVPEEPHPDLLTVASPEGIEVSDQLKLEKDVLRLLGSDLERVRPIAEALDLMPAKIDLNQSSPDSQNYYF